MLKKTPKQLLNKKIQGIVHKHKKFWIKDLSKIMYKCYARVEILQLKKHLHLLKLLLVQKMMETLAPKYLHLYEKGGDNCKNKKPKKCTHF